MLFSETDINENYEIPPLHHAIWLGKEIREAYWKHLEYLTSVRQRMGLPPIMLWTDASSREANSKLFADSPGIVVKNVEDLLNDFLNDAESGFTDEEKADFVKCILFEYLEPCNYAAISDYLRILILLKHGGEYADTDTFLKIFQGMRSAHAREFLREQVFQENFLKDPLFRSFFKESERKLLGMTELCFCSRELLDSSEFFYKKWIEFQKKIRDSYSFSIETALISKVGIMHAPNNNNYIMASKGHPALRFCMKRMVEKMKEVHSVSAECFSNEYRIYLESLESIFKGNFDANCSEEVTQHVGHQFFNSEHAWRLAKKSPWMLPYPLIGHIPDGASKDDINIISDLYIELLYVNRRKRLLAPALRELTIQIGPGCLGDSAEEWREFLEERGINAPDNETLIRDLKVEQVFDLETCDNTWLLKENASFVTEVDPVVESSVSEYEQFIEPMSFSRLCKEIGSHQATGTGMTGLVNEIKSHHLCSSQDEAHSISITDEVFSSRDGIQF